MPDGCARQDSPAGVAAGTDAADVEFSAGQFRVVGTDRAIQILDLAERLRTGAPEELSGGLDSVAKFVSPQMSFPNGCHVCEVEVDPETGVFAVVGYVAVDDASLSAPSAPAIGLYLPTTEVTDSRILYFASLISEAGRSARSHL